MEIGRILTRSLDLAWRYRVLWVFGFIMGLTGGSAGNAGNFYNYSFNRSDFTNRPGSQTPPFVLPQIPPPVIAVLVAGIACLSIIYLVLMLYFRFVARGSMVCIVRDVEKENVPTLRSAWREGHKYYVRLLGLGFLFYLPFMIITLVVLIAAILPFVGVIVAFARGTGSTQFSNSDFARLISGILISVALFCCSVLCLSLIRLVLHPVYEFSVRAIVLEESKVFEGIVRGYRRLKSKLGSIALLYVMLMGARIGWSLVTGVLAIPFIIILVAIATGGSAVFPIGAVVVLALVVAVPFFLLFAFIEGLFQVFESNAWTEAYLALQRLAITSPPTIQQASSDAPVEPSALTG